MSSGYYYSSIQYAAAIATVALTQVCRWLWCSRRPAGYVASGESMRLSAEGKPHGIAIFIK